MEIQHGEFMNATDPEAQKQLEDTQANRIKKFEIFPLQGINDLRFGMTPAQVKSIIGEPESARTQEDSYNKNVIERVERRYSKDMDFIYRDDKLVCISGDATKPFYIFDKKMPFTIVQLNAMLRSLSKLNFRYPHHTGAVYLDLGIALYLYETIDIRAGNYHPNSIMRIAVGTKEIMHNYIRYFEKAMPDRPGFEIGLGIIEPLINLESDISNKHSKLSPDGLDTFYGTDDGMPPEEGE